MAVAKMLADDGAAIADFLKKRSAIGRTSRADDSIRRLTG